MLGPAGGGPLELRSAARQKPLITTPFVGAHVEPNE